MLLRRASVSAGGEAPEGRELRRGVGTAIWRASGHDPLRQRRALRRPWPHALPGRRPGGPLRARTDRVQPAASSGELPDGAGSLVLRPRASGRRSLRPPAASRAPDAAREPAGRLIRGRDEGEIRPRGGGAPGRGPPSPARVPASPEGFRICRCSRVRARGERGRLHERHRGRGDEAQSDRRARIDEARRRAGFLRRRQPSSARQGGHRPPVPASRLPDRRAEPLEAAPRRHHAPRARDPVGGRPNPRCQQADSPGLLEARRVLLALEAPSWGWARRRA